MTQYIQVELHELVSSINQLLNEGAVIDQIEESEIEGKTPDLMTPVSIIEYRFPADK